MKQRIRLTESDLHRIVKESVKGVLNDEELRVLLKKAFSNLNGEERAYLYDMLNNDTWNTVYAALSVIESIQPN